ncbi:MAG: hypothetical protein NTX57_12340 [Armatimonadetes bacterium]|jgi:hypothetical protein|nr:hypothetical protein [Armatimonadota bacterium]
MKARSRAAQALFRCEEATDQSGLRTRLAQKPLRNGKREGKRG